MANAASTGFEGIQDAMAFEVAQEESRLARQFAAQAQLDGFGQFQMALSGGLNALVDRFRPSIQQRTAQAVTTARSNAMKAVEGEEYESPYLRQVAVLERTAEELEGQGFFTTAEKLRSNALALRTQAVEFQRLQFQTAREQVGYVKDAAEADAAPEYYEARAKGESASTQQKVADAKVAEQTVDSRISLALNQALDAEFEATVFNPLRAQSERLGQAATREQIASAQQSRAESRLRMEMLRQGETVSAQVDGLGVVAAQRAPDGTIRFMDPRTGKETFLPVGRWTPASLVGSGSQLAENSPARRAAVESELTAGNTLAMLSNLHREIERNPNSATVTGNAVAMVNSFAAEAKAIARIRDPGAFAKVSADASTWLTELGVSNAEQKALALNIAWAIARAREPSAPALSRADIEQSVQTAGLNNPSPAVRLSRIASLGEDIIRMTEERARLSGETLGPGWSVARSNFRALPNPLAPRARAMRGGAPATPPPAQPQRRAPPPGARRVE